MTVIAEIFCSAKNVRSWKECENYISCSFLRLLLSALNTLARGEENFIINSVLIVSLEKLQKCTCKEHLFTAICFLCSLLPFKKLNVSCFKCYIGNINQKDLDYLKGQLAWFTMVFLLCLYF